MKIRLFWVGKTTEGFIEEGIRKYMKLISRFCEVETVIIKEEKDKPLDVMQRTEAERILKQAKSFILLDEGGHVMSSKDFAGFLKDRAQVSFVLGGPYGVADDVRKSAGETLSLSPLTFTHEMSRLILLEQIYRAFMINTGRGYHHA